MGTTRFRKKPIVIDAVKWDETTETRKLLESMGMGPTSHSGHAQRPNECTNLRINTLEGVMRADAGDWIIKGVKGEFYPCKPDIFDATYEVEDAQSDELTRLRAALPGITSALEDAKLLASLGQDSATAWEHGDRVTRSKADKEIQVIHESIDTALASIEVLNKGEGES